MRDLGVRPNIDTSMRRVLLLMCAFVSCSEPRHTRVTYTVVSAPRDWAAHPALAEIDAPGTIYAMSDVHGGYERMTALLAQHGLVTEATRPEAARWTARDSILVVAGDLFDKGPASLDALDLLRTLEPQAASAGGRVVFTLGNHEAEFLDDPGNTKATKSDGVEADIHAHGLEPVAIANGSEPRGQWLRQAPLGVRVRGWFFAHAGDTHGRTIAELEASLRAGISAHDYHDDEVVGASSILESRGWYDDEAVPMRNARALGVGHIVFGHQPNALGPRGEIAIAQNGLLFRIDCGMSPNIGDSAGRLLRVRTERDVDVAEALLPDGTAHELWRGPSGRSR